MMGAHATMFRKEAAGFVDVVVTGSAESVWRRVLQDARQLRLRSWYAGATADFALGPAA